MNLEFGQLIVRLIDILPKSKKSREMTNWVGLIISSDLILDISNKNVVIVEMKNEKQPTS